MSIVVALFLFAELACGVQEDGDEIGDDEFGGDDELAEGMQAPAGGEF